MIIMDTYEFKDGVLTLNANLEETYTKAELEKLISGFDSEIRRNVNKSNNVLSKNLIPKKMKSVYEGFLNTLIKLEMEEKAK